MYMISNEVVDILADPADETRVKSRCISIKQIIDTILGRHKLERPPPYRARPPGAFGVTYHRRGRRGQGIHIDEPGQYQPAQDIVDVGPSQPPITQTQPTGREKYNLRRHDEHRND